MKNYNLSALRELVWNALIASETYALHRRSPERITDRKAWEQWYLKYDAEETSTWRSLGLACRLAGIDTASLIALEKAFRRHEKKLHWNWSVSLNHKNEISYRRNIQA